ncbi:MAG TPA: hypothetical protein VLE89_04270 [Chlamydiales bacterium]|nr:hypothetical protein [Chlamydiales bacterium]
MKWICILVAFIGSIEAYDWEISEKVPNPTLDKIYTYYAGLPARQCDIGEHMSLLRQLAKECQTVVEIGVGGVISTWGLLKGLSESSSPHRRYMGVDILEPTVCNFDLARKFATEQGIEVLFQMENDLYIDLDPVDLLFIDSLHTYCHLTYELETFSPKVGKYIAIHDTSEPWGDRNDLDYQGNYSEYPASYDRNKKGTWPAVVDFLVGHPEWKLQERRLNCHGFTVLKRIGDK